MKELTAFLRNKGFFFLTINTMLTLFGFSFIPLFLKENGYSLWQLIFLYAVYTFLASLFIVVISVFHIKTFLIMGLAFQGLTALLFGVYPSSTFYLYAALLALTTVFYWIPLNWIFFQQAQQKTNATHSSLYFLVPGIVSIILPPLGAMAVNTLGYHWLFGITGLLYLFFILLVHKIFPENYEEKVPFWKSFQQLKGIRTITFCDGALHFFGGAVLPIYGLLFLQTESDIGFYLSSLGFLGVILALFLARRSDASQQRKNYLFILFFLMSLSIISIFGLTPATARWQFFLGVGLFMITSTLSSPLRLAVSLDVKTADLSFWKSREFCLNAGRAATLAITAFFFYQEYYLPVFVMYGIIAIVYPLLVNYKMKRLS